MCKATQRLEKLETTQEAIAKSLMNNSLRLTDSQVELHKIVLKQKKDINRLYVTVALLAVAVITLL